MSGRILSSCLAAATLVVLLAGAGTAALAQQSPTRSRVVIQVSDGEATQWNLALNNAHNIQADLGAKNVDIEIVAYGPGIGMLKLDSPVANRISEMTATGVKIMACENTMHGRGLAPGDMLNGIGYVGSGVVEIMQRQEQGWSYIRP